MMKNSRILKIVLSSICLGALVSFSLSAAKLGSRKNGATAKEGQGLFFSKSKWFASEKKGAESDVKDVKEEEAVVKTPEAEGASSPKKSFWGKLTSLGRGKKISEKNDEEELGESTSPKKEKRFSFFGKKKSSVRPEGQPSEKTTLPVAEARPSKSAIEVIDQISANKRLLYEEERVSAKNSFNKGVELYRSFQFEESLRNFQKAGELMPENEAVLSYISRIKQILGQNKGVVKSYSDWNGERRSVEEQEMVFKIEIHMDKSKKLVEKAKVLWKSGSGLERNSALDFLQESRLELRKAWDAIRFVGVGTDVREMEDKIRKNLKNIEVLEESWKNTVSRDTEKSARSKAVDLAKAQSGYESDKLQKLLMQAKADYLNGHYEKSERLCRRILKEWPKNVDALRILSKAERRRDDVTMRKIRQRSEEEWLKNAEKIHGASIAYSDTIIYPEDWERINQRKTRSITYVEIPQWKKRMIKIMEKEINLILPDNTLEEALVSIQEQTGLNYNMDPGLFLDEAKISNLRLRDIPLKSALPLILNRVSAADDELVFELKDQAIYITSRARMAILSRPEQIRYDVTDLITSFSDFTIEGGLGKNQGLSGVGESRETESLGTEAIIDVIRETVFPESWDAAGSGVSINEFEGGKILISQSAEAHQQIEALLEMFRKLQTLQVSIETRFITSKESDIFDLGVEWSGLNEVQLEDSGISGVGAGAYSDRGNLASDSRGAVLTGSAASATVTGTTDFITGNLANGGFLAQVAVLDPIRAGLALHALSRKGNFREILAPRLTVLNNKQGYVIRSRDETYVSNFTNDNSNLNPQFKRVSTGELLVVRPTVSSDKKYITMDLSPQISRNVRFESRELRFFVTQGTNAGGRGGGGRGNNATTTRIDSITGIIELPEREVWQLQTRIQLPDGGVIFVGGKMGSVERKVSRGVPILSKLPLIGRLFRSDGEFNSLDNLIISVRAKILLFDEIEARQ